MDTNTQSHWSDLGLSQEMLDLISTAGYKHPSPVQEKTIPFALQGLDVLVSSQTGSGKTASFVIPTIERFKNKNGTYILALSPTREIAQQTGEVFTNFAKPFGMKVVVCIGGADMNQEKEALSSSPHIIVATPGRLCDHLERGNVWLDFIQCLIFDEADRMLEMGFSKQIDLITDQLPKERQTLMLSATFAPDVEKLARKAMKNPEKVLIERTAETAPKIEQELFWLPEDKKLDQLVRILRREKGTVFVFVNAKEKTFQLARQLYNRGIEDVTYINSDLEQAQREQAVADFKSGKYRIIVATDVMGRGIDVDDVAHVVNFDVPKEAPDYIHRIGRTGRRGQTGFATTLAIPGKDDKAINAIAKLRGVQPPTKPEARDNRGAKNEGQRDGRQNSRRDEKPREHRGPRPEGERREARSSRPQGERRERRPRDHQAPRNQARDVKSVATPEVTQALVKPAGFLEKVKSFFGFGKK